MSNSKTAGMSASERKAYNLRRLYNFLPIVSVGLLILLWTTVSGNSDFPSPKETYDRMILLFERPVRDLNIFGHVWHSLLRIFAALIFNWTFGIAFGILIGWNKKAKDLLTPLFN